MAPIKLFYQIIKFSFLALLISNNLHAQTEEWRGWRGLQYQGQSSSENVPTEWSDTTNIAWFTAIQGIGHSSPVVSKDKVFITAAWNTTEQTATGNIITVLIAISAALLFISILFYSRKQTAKPVENISGLLTSHTFWLFLGIFFYSLFFSHWLPEGFTRTGLFSRFNIWFHSGVVVAFSCLLTIIFHDKKSYWKTAVGLILIFWAGFLLFNRPSPDYFFILPIRIITLTRMIIPCLLIALAGLLLLFPYQRNVNKQKARFKERKIAKHHNITQTLIFLFGLSGLGSIFLINFLKQSYAALFQGNSQFIDPSFSLTDQVLHLLDPALSYPWYLFFINIGFLLWLYLYIKNSTKPIDSSLNKWFSPAILAIAALSFIQVNYANTDTGMKRGVICLDRINGKVIWQKSGITDQPENRTHLNSPATPTALIDGERVYAYFGTSGLICYSYSGDILWTNNNLPFKGIHGIGASPMFAGDHIIILSGMSEAPYITAINRFTGESAWKTDLSPWKSPHGEHRTPLITTFQGKEIIVDWSGGGRQVLNIFSPADGKRLAQYPTPINYTGETVTTVIAEEDILYLSWKSGAIALDLAGIMRGDKDCKIWEVDLGSRGPNAASPVFYNTLLFIVSDNGHATCIDSQNGNIFWRERLAPGRYYSSPIAVNGNIYFTNNNGITQIIRAGADYELINKNQLPGKITASLAPLGKHLFVRTEDAIWCIEKRQ